MLKKIILNIILIGIPIIMYSQIDVEVLRSEYEQVNDEIYDINDTNEGSFNYAITAGNSNNYYQIDTNSGVITIQNTISDSFNSVHTDVLTVTAGTTTYLITIVDGYDFIIANLDPDYTVLDEHNEKYINNSNDWTVINNLWGRGDAVPNVDFRIATIYKPTIPNSTILIWDVPSNASAFNGASVWNYNNVFWGNRKNIREDLTGFPFQISSLESLSVNFDFEQLFGNDKFKIAMNMFMTDEDVLSNFSANDGDFFFVFDQNGTYIPNYTNTLPDITIDGKPFAVRYDLNPDTGYERRRVIVKDNEKLMTGTLDVKSLFDMFIDETFLNPDQYIYHIQFGIEVTSGYGAVRFNQLNVNAQFESLSVSTFKEENLKTYPNPFNTILTVEGISKSVNSIKLFNSLGQEFKLNNNYSIDNNQLKLNLESLKTGMYFLQIDGYVTKVFKK